MLRCQFATLVALSMSYIKRQSQTYVNCIISLKSRAILIGPAFGRFLFSGRCNPSIDSQNGKVQFFSLRISQLQTTMCQKLPCACRLYVFFPFISQTNRLIFIAFARSFEMNKVIYSNKKKKKSFVPENEPFRPII